MITPAHLVFDFAVYSIFIKTGGINYNWHDILLIFLASFIDLDHLFSKPIYHPKRNPFKTHFLHKNWKIILTASCILMFWRKSFILGYSLISHLFLDFIYVKRNKL